jgi:hypothetical protein
MPSQPQWREWRGVGGPPQVEHVAGRGGDWGGREKPPMGIVDWERDGDWGEPGLFGGWRPHRFDRR